MNITLRVVGLTLVAWAAAPAPPPAWGQIMATADSGAVAGLHTLIRATNPELDARRAAVAAAEARLSAAGALGPAVLSAEVEEVPDGLDVAEAGSLRLDLGREVSGGGRRAAARAMASERLARARLDLSLTERRLIAEAEGMLAHHLGFLAVAERLTAQDSLLAGAEEALTTRFAVGESRYVEVLRLRAERLRTRVEIAEAQAEAFHGRQGLIGLVAPADSAIQRLVASLATLGARADTLVTAMLFPPTPSLDSLVSASGAVQVAQAAVRQAEAGLQVTDAEQRTRMTASVGVQRFGEGGNHHVGATLGASVTLPFTSAGAGGASRLAARQDIRAAESETRAALSRTRAALATARVRYETAVANASLYEEGLMQGAREERENALAAYRTGTLSLLELLDFERALAQAEVSRYRSRVDAAEAFAELLAGAAMISNHGEAELGPSGGDS